MLIGLQGEIRALYVRVFPDADDIAANLGGKMSRVRRPNDRQDGSMRVPVSLRGGGSNRFFSDYEIQIKDGTVEPIEHQGRRYTFSHTIATSGYRAAGQQDVHVFTELTFEG